MSGRLVPELPWFDPWPAHTNIFYHFVTSGVMSNERERERVISERELQEKKNIQKTIQNALAPGIFIVLSIALKLGTPLLHTQAQNELLQNFSFRSRSRDMDEKPPKALFYPTRSALTKNREVPPDVIFGLYELTLRLWKNGANSAVKCIRRLRLWACTHVEYGWMASADPLQVSLRRRRCIRIFFFLTAPNWDFINISKEEEERQGV